MDSDKQKIQAQIDELEALMQTPDFWSDKNKAQETIREHQELKDKLEGVGKYDKSHAIITVFAGAGGDDAEDFGRILVEMYFKYAERKGFSVLLIHENQNDHGGYRNITFEIEGKGAYGILKNESGVHRLVRLSPFNSKSQRHTSFCLVEVLPKFEKTREIEIPEQDLKVEFTRSSGPGGQNVNKRDTAVRLTHVPTGLTVHCEAERSQQANRERALSILEAKLFKKMEEERILREKNMYVSKTTEIEWGNQIRSYVIHPYKLVKDYRTEVETSDVEAVLDGEIELFLEAEKDL
jgi:peptide chain release factor 2